MMRSAIFAGTAGLVLVAIVACVVVLVIWSLRRWPPAAGPVVGERWWQPILLVAGGIVLVVGTMLEVHVPAPAGTAPYAVLLALGGASVFAYLFATSARADRARVPEPAPRGADLFPPGGRRWLWALTAANVAALGLAWGGPAGERSLVCDGRLWYFTSTWPAGNWLAVSAGLAVVVAIATEVAVTRVARAARPQDLAEEKAGRAVTLRLLGASLATELLLLAGTVYQVAGGFSTVCGGWPAVLLLHLAAIALLAGAVTIWLRLRSRAHAHATR